MNRLVVRLLLAFLAVIAVTGVSVVASLVFVLALIGRSMSEASLKRIVEVTEAALNTVNVAPTAEENYVLLALLLASVVVATVLALLLARRIAAPLEGVSKAASRVALGDWSARAGLSKQDARGGSETARLVRNFNRMAMSLESLETERQATVAAIAHELRTPLTVLRGRLEAVRDGVLPATGEEFGVLIGQVELLSRLVADLRTLSLAEAGQLSLERTRTDLGALVRAVASAFDARARDKGVRLEVVAPEGAWLEAADAERLHQVIANLLENAIRHTDEGFVRVTLEPGLAALTLTVRDTGAGIPPEALPRLFERFYRADASRARASGGSGLGLSIARAIVHLHGGEISAGNHPDGGAVFTVTLPRQPASSPAPSPRGRRAATRLAPVGGRTPLEPAALESDGFIAPGTFTAVMYHALSFPLAVLYLILGALGFGLGIGLSVLGVGLLILGLTLVFARSAVSLECWLSDALLGVNLRLTNRPARGAWGLARLGWLLRDPLTWRSVGYLCLKVPYALVGGALLLALGLSSVVLLVAPVIVTISRRAQINLIGWRIDSLSEGFIAALVGAALLWLTMRLSDALAWLWTRIAKGVLEEGLVATQAISSPAAR
jgi:two-component system sensor histidine kinase BaeS